MSNPIGQYDFLKMKRGDTFVSRVIATLTNAETDAAIPVSSATMEVRTKPKGALVHRWSTEDDPATASISDNAVTLSAVASSTTAAWPAGSHVYELEVVLTDGSITRKILEGKFPVGETVFDS